MRSLGLNGFIVVFFVERRVMDKAVNFLGPKSEKVAAKIAKFE